LRKTLKVIPLIVATAIVLALFVLGRLPGAGSLFPSPWDRLAHLCVYGALAICLRLGAGHLSAAWVVLITAVIGLLDEIHQAFIPGRTAGIIDFLADTCGALAGVAALKAWDALRSLQS